MTRRKWSSSAEIAFLVRKCLEEGNLVEIDGLGVFRPDGSGGFDFEPNTRPRIFLAYVTEDVAWVDRIGVALDDSGFDPWIDRHKLVPGQNWPRAIERAIEVSDFFLACLSSHSVSKRGRFQAELRYALDCAALMPQDGIFFIPVRLDECAVPPAIARSFQYVDLFPHWEKGIRRITGMLRKELRLRPPRRPLAA